MNLKHKRDLWGHTSFDEKSASALHNVSIHRKLNKIWFINECARKNPYKISESRILLWYIEEPTFLINHRGSLETKVSSQQIQWKLFNNKSIELFTRVINFISDTFDYS